MDRDFLTDDRRLTPEYFRSVSKIPMPNLQAPLGVIPPKTENQVQGQAAPTIQPAYTPKSQEPQIVQNPIPPQATTWRGQPNIDSTQMAPMQDGVTLTPPSGQGTATIPRESYDAMMERRKQESQQEMQKQQQFWAKHSAYQRVKGLREAGATPEEMQQIRNRVLESGAGKLREDGSLEITDYAKALKSIPSSTDARVINKTTNIRSQISNTTSKWVDQYKEGTGPNSERARVMSDYMDFMNQPSTINPDKTNKDYMTSSERNEFARNIESIRRAGNKSLTKLTERNNELMARAQTKAQIEKERADQAVKMEQAQARIESQKEGIRLREEAMDMKAATDADKAALKAEQEAFKQSQEEYKAYQDRSKEINKLTTQLSKTSKSKQQEPIKERLEELKQQQTEYEQRQQQQPEATQKQESYSYTNPQEAVNAVAAEYPNWSDDQIKNEARRRWSSMNVR